MSKKYEFLDIRLYTMPAAIEDAGRVINIMTGEFEKSLRQSFKLLINFDSKALADITEAEIRKMVDAVDEILGYTVKAVTNDDLFAATGVGPLEDVIDLIKKQMHKKHIERLQNNSCTIEMVFVLSDIITILESIADHCSNLTLCVIEIQRESLGMHEKSRYLKKSNSMFPKRFEAYYEKYRI